MNYSAPQENLFSLLPPARTPWTEFFFSTGTQACILALLAWVRLVYPTVVTPQEHTFRSIQLVATPVPVNHLPQPEVRQRIVARVEPPSTALRIPSAAPKVTEKAEEVRPPEVTVAARKMDPLPMNTTPVVPKQAVRTNVFSGGSSVAPTIARAPSEVQTGGFGDPNGIPAKAGQGKVANIAAAGSFDAPVGAGVGNGTGGSKGASGFVASTGFGNGVATGNSRSGVSRNGVQASGFASADVPAGPTVHSRSAEPVHAVPAEILSKPVPVYTQEAKNLRIEGEVLLEVVLEASGSLKVVRLVRGLGHGLDDNAVKAAEQIHFKPAMKDGQPADSTVVLHIIFQLA